MATFDSAFAAAKKAGKKTFTWNGKKYTTETASTSSNSPKSKPRTLNTSSRPASKSSAMTQKAVERGTKLGTVTPPSMNQMRTGNALQRGAQRVAAAFKRSENTADLNRKRREMEIAKQEADKLAKAARNATAARVTAAGKSSMPTVNATTGARTITVGARTPCPRGYTSIGNGKCRKG